jgi:hypothetical protein
MLQHWIDIPSLSTGVAIFTAKIEGGRRFYPARPLCAC